MSRDEIELSPKDRIILSNQYAILEKLYPDDAEHLQELRTIVEEGYELHYYDLNPVIYEGHLSKAECREVMDILDMYRNLKDAFGRLTDTGDIKERDIQFEGFDGNNEPELASYARFLVLKQRKWQEVLEGRPHFDLNSHSAVIDMYRRMLPVWKSSNNKHDLSYEEIKSILDAGFPRRSGRD